MSAKQHSECGWRKPEVDKKPAQKQFVFKADDHHGFEKVKRKMLNLARQASLQYGWDGIIMGYAAKVGRGGSTARITYVSPQNELYCTDERGGIKVKQGLDDHLSINADNALTLIRQKICPTERMINKHDGGLMGHEEEVDGMPVQGPELPPGMEDKGDGLGADLSLQWLANQVTEKRGELDLEKSGLAQQMGHHHHHHHAPPAPAPLHAGVMGHHVQMPSQHSLHPGMEMHLPLDGAMAQQLQMEDHKRKMMQMEAIHKRARNEE